MTGFLRSAAFFISLLCVVSSQQALPNCKCTKCKLVIENTNTACSRDEVGLTRFRAAQKVLEICDGTRWLQVPLVGIKGVYGSSHNPGFSCLDIYTKAQQSLPNGVYWIRITGRSQSFPVYCDMQSGGWTMGFKAVSGVPSVAGDLWQTPFTAYEDTLRALDVSNGFKQHYKNRIVKNWSAFSPSEARVVLYNSESEVLQLKFNAKGSSNLNWYSMSRLVGSPWTDIATAPKNVFSIKGTCHPKLCRSFMINSVYAGCPGDLGWLTMTAPVCPWEKRLPFTSILYSKVGTRTNWNTHKNVGVADVMAVYVR